MPTNPPGPAHFSLQSVFAVGGQAVLMGQVTSGEIMPGMTTIIQDKKCTVTKVEGKSGDKVTQLVVGVTLANLKIEDLQTMDNKELVFIPNRKVS